MNNTAENLIAKADIIDALHRWCRGVDRCDADMAKSAYHDDGTDDHGIFQGLGHDFVDLAINSMKGQGITSHYLSNIIIQVEGDTAFAESYVLYFQSGSPGEAGALWDVVIGGRYIDRFAKRDGHWRIADRQSIFDWNQTLKSTAMWHGTPHELYRPRGTQDKSDVSFKSPLFENVGA